MLPQTMWTNNFLKGQGMKVADMVLYHDNMSSILLEENGRSSSLKWTKDRVASKEIQGQQGRCWQTSSPNHCKENTSTSYETIYLYNEQNKCVKQTFSVSLGAYIHSLD